MDLNNVSEILAPATREELPAPHPHTAYLAGGTWLFSEPQPGLTRLVDITRLGWPPLTLTETQLQIAATCPIAILAVFDPPPSWLAGPLILKCCRALLGSFKIWNMATVGGNLCMALPAGPMAPLFTALDATCLIWRPDGAERTIPAKDFITAPQQTVLKPGELLRHIDIPLASFAQRTAFRQISLSPLGRSGALLIGTLGENFALTIAAATTHPIRHVFSAPPAPETLRKTLAEIPDAAIYDDVHGRPAWRRHMINVFAQEILAELTAA